jgi:hypothetical protein
MNALGISLSIYPLVIKRSKMEERKKKEGISVRVTGVEPEQSR